HARVPCRAARAEGADRRDRNGGRAGAGPSCATRARSTPRRPGHGAEREPDRSRSTDDGGWRARSLPRRSRSRARRRAAAGWLAVDRGRRHRGPAPCAPSGSRYTGHRMKITGVIQAGGRSTRMGGEPKALLELGGKRIVERVVDTLTAVLDDVLVVTNTPERYEFLRLPMVADRYPDGGALGGIFTGLEAAGRDAVFHVACGLPFPPA